MARWILRAATYVLSFADKNLQIFAGGPFSAAAPVPSTRVEKEAEKSPPNDRGDHPGRSSLFQSAASF